MATVEALIKEGYFIKDVSPNGDQNLASFSLLSSLRSYFQTAQGLSYLLRRAETEGLSQDDFDKACGSKYATDACDAITHFQHFLELYVKDILLEDNPLMVYDASRKPELLYDLIHGNPIPDEKLERVTFIEFSEAIDRLKENLGNFDHKYSFLSKYFDLMKKLNQLRNRIAHRGAFVIRYKALDELFCGYLLPFIEEIKASTPDYTQTLEWGFNLHTKIDVYKELVDEYKKASINIKRVYLLKLIAHCAYNNDIPYFEPTPANADPFDVLMTGSGYEWLYDEKKSIIAQRAMGEAEQRFGRVEKCPICGCNSFVLENDYYETEEGADVPYVYDASCHHCGFHLETELLDPSVHGLPLLDYSQMT